MKEDSSILFNRQLVDAQVALYGAIFAMVGNDDAAMSILQDTNAALIRRSAEYDASRPLLPLFKRFAVVQVHSWRNRHRLDRLVFDDELVSAFAENLAEPEMEDGDFSEACDLRFLSHCMEKVPPDDREMLKERYFANLSVKEMAAEKHVSEKSLAVWMFRIRQALKECIEKARRRFARMDTDNPDDVFISRLESFLDNTLSPEEHEAFCASMKANPAYIPLYLQHVQLSASLRCRKRELFSEGEASHKPVFRVRLRAVSTAAALLALLAGGIFLSQKNHGDRPRNLTQNDGERPRTSASSAVTAQAAGSRFPVRVAPPPANCRPDPLWQPQSGCNGERPQKTLEIAKNDGDTPKNPLPAAMEAAGASEPKKESDMNKSGCAAVAAAALATASLSPQRTVAETGTDSNRSTPAPFCMDAAGFWVWNTLDTSAPVLFRWAWPDGADSAELSIKGYKSSFTTNLTDTSVTSLAYSFDKPKDMETETVYDLSMAFKRGGNTLAGKTLSARLAAIRGVGQRSACRFLTQDTLAKWPKVKYSAVLPLLPVSESLAVDSHTNALGAVPGWFALTNLTCGLHSIALITPSSVYSNTLMRISDGFVIMLR